MDEVRHVIPFQNPFPGNRTMKVLDLYAGMGGFSSGFSEQGFSVHGVDCNIYSKDIFEINRIGRCDIADVTSWSNNEWYDVVIGGPPCRPWATTNLKKVGKAHNSYTLMGCFFKQIDAIKPNIFIMENVPRSLKDLILFVKDIRKEYFYSTIIIDYHDYGAPIRKKRLLLIGCHKSAGFFPRDIVIELLKRRERGKTCADAIGRTFYGDPQHEWPNYNISPKIEKLCVLGKFGYMILKWDKPARTFVNPMRTYVLHPDYFNGTKRIISIREALCLMGFKNDFRFVDGMSMFMRYQMVADSVSPMFSRKLAEIIKRFY